MRANVSVDSLDDASKAAEYESQASKWFVAWFHVIERFGKYIFVFWLVIYAISFLYGPKFLTMGDDSVKPPKNTPSFTAQEEFERRFQEQAKQVPMLVFVKSKTHEVDVTTQELFTFSKQLKANVLEYNATTGDGNVISTMSYYELANTLLDGAKSEFISASKDATFMNLMLRGDRITADRYEFVKFMKKQVKQLNPDPKLFSIGITGFDAMAYDGAEDSAKNVAKIDIVTVPIAMVLLGVMIRSWRLLIFAGMNLGCSILASFAFMAFLVEHGGAPNPESSTAQLMEVITMAISIDWSLFLHRRYRDEIKRGATPREAAFLAYLHSGHVVVMSGSTLVVVFIGFIVLPAASVQMDGACCSVGVIIAMLIALTNTPAVWLAFPEFCSDFDPKCCKRRTVDDLDKEAARLGISDVVNAMTSGNAIRSTLVSAPLIDSEEFDDSNNSVPLLRKPTTHAMYDGPRFRFTRWITKFPNNIMSIVLVYVLVIPLALQVKDIQINQNILDYMPRNSESAQTFRHAFETFPGGTFAPFYVMITTKDPDDKDKVLNNAFFDAARSVAVDTLKSCKQLDNRFSDQSVTAPVLLNGIPIPLGQAQAFLRTAKRLECNPMFGGKVAPWWKEACSMVKEFELEWNQAVNRDENAMLITITVPFFPFSQESHDFIDTVNAVLDAARERYSMFDFHFCGVEVGFDALQRRVEGLFPTLLATTFGIVFVILGLLLRSAFVPFRLALTLVAPLCAVFGSAVLVYQKGALEWTGFAAFNRMEGFYWYIPILLLSMIIGLSLDWDVLLVSRIMEHRENGYDIRASIVKATCETGGTISTAGVIMCLAFGGMLLSDQLTINACGFILTVALLLDTFVVNTILVPALISIGDNIAWWPVQMPMTELKTLYNCEEFPQDEK